LKFFAFGEILFLTTKKYPKKLLAGREGLLIMCRVITKVNHPYLPVPFIPSCLVFHTPLIPPIFTTPTAQWPTPPVAGIGVGER
jgi:hypothetical protein